MSNPFNFDVDLKKVDTTPPRLPAGLIPVQVSKSEIKQNKREDGYNWVVTFSTTEPLQDSKGERTINPGYPLTAYLPLQPSDNPKAPDFREGLAKLIDAAFGTSMEDRPTFNEELVGAIVGQELKLRISLEDDPTYGLSNNIKGYASL